MGQDRDLVHVDTEPLDIPDATRLIVRVANSPALNICDFEENA